METTGSIAHSRESFAGKGGGEIGSQREKWSQRNFFPFAFKICTIVVLFLCHENDLV